LHVHFARSFVVDICELEQYHPSGLYSRENSCLNIILMAMV